MIGITNRGKYGLQIGAGQGITNRGSRDYKLGQVKRLQNGAKGLQIGAGITKRGRDYKSVQYNKPNISTLGSNLFGCHDFVISLILKNWHS